jgi:DNA-binding CsgD family transcriptional regulator
VPSVKLTQREQQTLALIGAGKTSKEIALEMNLSVLTVGNYRKNLCRKLGARSTAELVVRAITFAASAGTGER